MNIHTALKNNKERKHPDCDEKEQKSCEGCEFRLSRKSGTGIGTVLSGERGEFYYCEKGFWKEET